MRFVAIVACVFAAAPLVAQSRPDSRAAADSRPAPDSRAVAASRARAEAAFARLFAWCPENVECLNLTAPTVIDRWVWRFRDEGFREPTLREDANYQWIRLLGASRNFKPCQCLGHNPIESLELIELAEPLVAIEPLLAPDVRRYVIAGMGCYALIAPPRAETAPSNFRCPPEDRWVALVDPHILITTNSRALLEEALAAPRAGRTVERALARLGFSRDTVDLSSWMSVVRRYEPANRDDPTSPLREGLEIAGIAFSYEARTHRGTLSVRSDDPNAAAKFYFNVELDDPEARRRFRLLPEASPGVCRFAIDFGTGGGELFFFMTVTGSLMCM